MGCSPEAELFVTLGHPVRVRLLAVLGDGERSVGDLQAALSLESSGASQQFAALCRQGLVGSRREGTTVYDWVRDRRTARLLESIRQILTRALGESSDRLGRLGEHADVERASEPGTGL